jgi:hypothetical protein
MFGHLHSPKCTQEVPLHEVTWSPGEHGAGHGRIETGEITSM